MYSPLSGKKTKIDYQNVPLLSEVTYRSPAVAPHQYLKCKFEDFKCRIQLKKLVLSINSTKYPSFKRIDFGFKCTPKFQCLKHLELLFYPKESICLVFFVWLINIAPFLSTFVIQFSYGGFLDKAGRDALLHSYQSSEAQTLLKTYRHEHLRVVKLMNTGLYWTEFRFMMCLLQVAASVEKIVIKPGLGFCGCDRNATVREPAKQLETILPKDSQLIIL